MHKTIGLQSKCANQWWLLRREARSASTDPSLPIMWPCHVILSSFLGHMTNILLLAGRAGLLGQSWSIVLLVINLLSLLISTILGSLPTALLPQYEWTNAPMQLYYRWKYIKQARARIVLNWRNKLWLFIPQANINKWATVCFLSHKIQKDWTCSGKCSAVCGFIQWPWSFKAITKPSMLSNWSEWTLDYGQMH